MISVIAKLPIKEDKMDEAVAAIKELVKDVAKEEGTLFYTLNRDAKNPSTLVFMERYKDKDALNVHSNTPHFKVFFSKSGAWLSGKPEIAIMEEIVSAKE
jgi:quinol monooxygenase YgiN